MHIFRKSESQSVDSRINKSVNIVVDREDERQGKSWKRMSDKEKMVDIIGFIQKSWVISQKWSIVFVFSMRSVQKTMELDREESIEEEEKQEKKSVVKKQKNTNKSNGVGSFFGYWRRTRTGKMKMIFTQLESTPFMITGKGKKFYVLEDIKKREKKRKSLRVVKFEWIWVKL